MAAMTAKTMTEPAIFLRAGLLTVLRELLALTVIPEQLELVLLTPMVPLWRENGLLLSVHLDNLVSLVVAAAVVVLVVVLQMEAAALLQVQPEGAAVLAAAPVKAVQLVLEVAAHFVSLFSMTRQQQRLP